MSYGIWLYIKRIIFFSTSRIFHFWNKVPVCGKKGENVFYVSLCTTLPYMVYGWFLKPPDMIFLTFLASVCMVRWDIIYRVFEKLSEIEQLYYIMSTGAVRWLAYEMVEKNNNKEMHCNNIGFLELSAILTINFTN